MNSHFRTFAMRAIICGVGFTSSAALAASLSPADHDFLVDTAQGATYELAVAKLAVTKATRSDIKSYATTMINDHESLNSKLQSFAKQNGVDLPTTMTDAKQQSFDHLKSLDGEAFNTAFVNEEVKDNAKDLADEQKIIGSTDSANLKSLVEDMKQADTKHAALGKALQQAGH